MTHEQTPEIVEFQTRGKAIASLAFHLHEGTCDVCWSIATIMAEEFILKAEARGAAEQRRKDAEGIEEAKDEGANFVLTSLALLFGRGGFEIRDGSETWEGDVHATLEGILEAGGLIDDEGDIRNVAALEARVKELEGAIVVLLPLVEACEQEFIGPMTESDADESAVGASAEKDMAITFGHIRNARKILDDLKGKATIREGE